MIIRPDMLVSPVDESTAALKRLAPRLDTLNGKAIGFLDNRKGNGNVILEHLAYRLSERFQLSEVVFREKFIFSRPASAEVLDEIQSRCDAVIAAIGD